MPGRKYSGPLGYRYGFNGKENDNEVKGEGNQQDYGMRIYDPRVGRFLSMDPLTTKYPDLTPYQFASNRPIDGIDLDGLEWTKSEVYFVSPTGKYATDYKIKISLADEKNHYSVANNNTTLIKIKERTEQIMSNNNAAGTPSDPIVNAYIKFTDEPGPFVASFRDFHSYSDYDPTTGNSTKSGDQFAYGTTQNGANSQTNKVDIALSNKLVLTQNGLRNITVVDDKNSDETVSRSLAHELGHTVGLYHPFSELNDIPEIDNSKGLPPENNKALIINNLMNSDKNPIKELRSNSGTELIPEQREKIKKTVETQQVKKPS